MEMQKSNNKRIFIILIVFIITIAIPILINSIYNMLMEIKLYGMQVIYCLIMVQS